MLISVFLLILGFLLLVKGADYLVEGASALAVRARISEIVVGLTVVSFGTSAPELVVNILASFGGQPDIAFGNVVGSNIVNILLILGVAGIIRPIRTKKNTVWKEIPFSLLAVIILFVMCNDYLFDRLPDVLSRSDGLLLLIFMSIFLTYTFGISQVESQHSPEIKPLGTLKIGLFIAVGLAGLILGGKLAVNNAVIIARTAGLSEKLIGLTIVAIGTSFPELFTSAIAAYKNKTDLAIGNVVGSNIFNIFFILGLSAFFRPIPFTPVLNADILILLFASLLLFMTMFTGRKRLLDRWEAVLFLFFYAGYIIFLLIRN